MSSSRQKQDSTRAGRKPPQPVSPPSPAMVEASAASNFDITMLQSMIDSLKSDIFDKIDTLATTLRSEIAAVRQELKSRIEPLERTVDAHEDTMKDLEHAATDHSTRITQLEAQVSTLTSELKDIKDKQEDLESRSRRNNIRVIGVPEGLEGPRATDFLAQLLQKQLNLEEKPLLDRAHRAGREKPSEGNSPRVFIARVHFFHVRNLILQRAGEMSPLLYQGKRISIFPDYTPSVAKKRAAFGAIKRNLRSFPQVKYGLLFPATLRITLPDGTSRRFEDPAAATDFVNKNCK